ncbi:type IA DNA topoisomerase [Sutcliffiella horikoshii]|uniref:type IA DNA topoisomerase n=1 Tax=Sutcliffiella horikoshii TaxID=79883 RepID=UPI0020419A4B
MRLVIQAQPRVVSENEALEFPDILAALGQITSFSTYFPTPIPDISSNKRFVDGKNVDDHYAIIPTIETPDIMSLTSDEQRIYQMIALRFIAAHHPPAIYNQISIVTLIDEQFTFVTKGKQLVEPGWRSVLKLSNPAVNNKETDEFIPTLAVGDVVKIDSLETIEGKTMAPPRYTQGQIVKVMEQAGRTVEKDARGDYSTKELSLGTVATRASIIKQIIAKSYIDINDNLIYLTPKGRQLIEVLGEGCWISSPITTGNMERYLEEIGTGKRKHEPFINRVNELVTQLIQELQDKAPSWEIEKSLLSTSESKINNNEQVGNCKSCGEPVVDKGNFYGCSSFRVTGCDFSIPKTFLTKELTSKIVSKILETGNSGLLTGFKKKNITDEYYDAFIVWDENKKRLSLTFPPNKVSL